ncbi:MAG: adenylosuccinate synthetase [Paludibacteraceae bacterium]|nr:adenylosuccinate synthetase [Paludibacteraceae bacterium]
MKARIIIGANYGDEGKGTVVATYAKHAKGKTLNVLTNGGAQRAHSILTENGSFTFQHFGAATPYGADNYFSPFFILNPMQFVFEYNALAGRNAIQGVKFFRDKECRWSTPYDMLANQIIEFKRKGGKHGSCGMGIWETTLRYQSTVTIRFDTFCGLESAERESYLKSVRGYFERRIGDIPTDFLPIWTSENLISHYIEDCLFLYKNTNTVFDFTKYDEIIFENGQGLLLNDTGLDIAGTTPSKTTAEYALRMADVFSCDDISIHYVTRPYLTRHGKGTLEREQKRSNLSVFVEEDRTNRYNEFQDDFRYGQLDIEALAERIKEAEAEIKKPHTVYLDVTHCDEMDREAEFRRFFPNIRIYDRALIV